MINDNNTPLKKSRNLKIDSFPKISQTYTLFKKNIKNKIMPKNIQKKTSIKNKYVNQNFKLIQRHLLKYKTSNKRYEKIIINNLIASSKNHIFASFRDIVIFEYKGEFLKRFYKIKESKLRIPKFSKYYRNYLKFFCKSNFVQFSLNKLIHDFYEKQARIYYSIQKKKKTEKIKQKNEKSNIKKVESSLKLIFDKTVKENIEETSSIVFLNSFNNLNDESKTIPENTSFNTYKESHETSIKSILNIFKVENLKKQNERNRIKSSTKKKDSKNKVNKKKKINTDINYINLNNKNFQKKFINFKPIFGVNTVSPYILSQMKLKSLQYLQKNSFSESQISKVNKGKSNSKEKIYKNKTRNLKVKPFLNLDSESLTSRILKTDTQCLNTSKGFIAEKNSCSNKNKTKKLIKLSDFMKLNLNQNKKIKNKNFKIKLSISKDNSSKREKSINQMKNNLEKYNFNQTKRSRNKVKRIIKIENEYYKTTYRTIMNNNYNILNDLFRNNNYSFSSSSKIIKTSFHSSISNVYDNHSLNKRTKIFHGEKNNNKGHLNNFTLKNNFLFEKEDMYKNDNKSIKKKRKNLTIK